MFIVGKKYSRKEIYALLNVPIHQQEGNWNTGYTQYNNEYYIFANIGVAGRTGENHNNRFKNEMLEWSAKRNTNIKQPTIIKMTDNSHAVHVFTRDNNNITSFTYHGLGVAETVIDTSPVKVLWKFK